MKIRRKLPKPSGSGQPLYLIGYSSPAPSAAELQMWFDLEYGGPLKLKDRGGTMIATHGPWTAALQIALPDSEAERWQQQLGWRHPHAGLILRPSTTPRTACDTILHAARLARGLTLMTQGTAYDVFSHLHLNPSDWTDRPLIQFRAADHVAVTQTDAPEARAEWFHTLGLSKFGLDEFETLRPIGLSGRPILDTLAAIAEEILRMGRMPNVGTTLPLPLLGLSFQVLRHRTAAPTGLSLAFREIAWRPPE